MRNRQAPIANILVVEDDELVRRLVGTVLQRKGYSISFAGDGIAAVQVARKDPPDLILLDALLPGGDGVKVLERIRGLAALQSVPVIMMSGADPEAFRPRAFQFGACDYLEKPISPSRLLDAVDNALNGADAMAPLLGLVGAFDSGAAA